MSWGLIVWLGMCAGAIVVSLCFIAWQMGIAKSQLWVMRVLKWRHPHLAIVKLLHYDNQISYSVAEPAPDRTLVSYHFWPTRLGQAILKPDGSVDGSSKASYFYAWEHVDPDLRVIQALTVPDHKSINWWSSLTLRQKMEARHEI